MPYPLQSPQLSHALSNFFNPLLLQPSQLIPSLRIPFSQAITAHNSSTYSRDRVPDINSNPHVSLYAFAIQQQYNLQLPSTQTPSPEDLIPSQKTVSSHPQTALESNPVVFNAGVPPPNWMPSFPPASQFKSNSFLSLPIPLQPVVPNFATPSSTLSALQNPANFLNPFQLPGLVPFQFPHSSWWSPAAAFAQATCSALLTVDFES